MNNPSNQQIARFIKEARLEDNSGNFEAWVSDRELANSMIEARHLRSQRIPRDMSKEGFGQPVHAFYIDKLHNCVALCKDGHIRQYI